MQWKAWLIPGQHSSSNGEEKDQHGAFGTNPLGTHLVWPCKNPKRELTMSARTTPRITSPPVRTLSCANISALSHVTDSLARSAMRAITGKKDDPISVTAESQRFQENCVRIAVGIWTKRYAIAIQAIFVP